MAFLDLPLTSYELMGADGQVHRFYGCSLAGKFEFQDRLGEIAIALSTAPEYLTPEHLYLTDAKFRWLCDRCLELNGIKPDWVNWAMLEALLLADEAVLLTINQPRESAGVVVGNGEPQTLEEIIAILAETEGGFEEAIAVASEYPASTVEGYLDARADLHKTPEQKQKEEVQRWAAKKKAGGAGGKFKPGQQIKLPIPPTDEEPPDPPPIRRSPLPKDPDGGSAAEAEIPAKQEVA